MARNLIWIEDVGAGQWNVTNGKRSIWLRQDEGIVPVAEMFGMRLRHKRPCSKTRTDGSVDCPECGQTQDAFFGQAYEYLDGVVEWGKRVTDPGYFEE